MEDGAFFTDALTFPDAVAAAAATGDLAFDGVLAFGAGLGVRMVNSPNLRSLSRRTPAAAAAESAASRSAAETKARIGSIGADSGVSFNRSRRCCVRFPGDRFFGECGLYFI